MTNCVKKAQIPITENIKYRCFFQWHSYDNNVIILRNEILISYIITQEDK